MNRDKKWGSDIKDSDKCQIKLRTSQNWLHTEIFVAGMSFGVTLER